MDGGSHDSTPQSGGYEELFPLLDIVGFHYKNPAADPDEIPGERRKVDPFSREEMEHIFSALLALTVEYGCHDQPVTDQTCAFILVMRYNGMSIGDTAKLERRTWTDAAFGLTARKSGKDVLAWVLPFVSDALNAAPHDSQRYYFWRAGKATCVSALRRFSTTRREHVS